MTDQGTMGIGTSAEPTNNSFTAADDNPGNPSGREFYSTTITPTQTTITTPNLASSPPRSSGLPRRHYQQWHKRSLRLGQPGIPYQPVVDRHSTQGIHYTQDYGDTVGEKLLNVVRVAYGNIDGFPAVTHTNPKAVQLHHWFRCMEVDFFAGAESKINWARMPHSGRLPEMFRSENDLRSIAAFNSNESFALKQYGGTFQLTMGQLAA